MKTTLVTTLSLVGVLGAGTAAALVNTSIFDSTPQNDAAAFVPGADLVQLTLPEPSATVIDPAQNAAGNATVVAAATANPSQIADTSNDMPAQSASTATEATSRIAGSATVNVTATTLPTDDTPNTTLPVDDTPDTTTPDTPETTTPAPQNPSLLTTYDLGGAGSVTVDVVNGRMTLIDATAAAGWVVTDAEVDAVANQVEVTLSDGSMIVDFEVGYVAGALVPDIRTEAVSSGHHDDDHDEDDHDEDDEDDDDDHDEDDHDDDEDDHDEDDEDHEDDD